MSVHGTIERRVVFIQFMETSKYYLAPTQPSLYMICHSDKGGNKKPKEWKIFFICAQYISLVCDYVPMNLSFSVSSANYSVNYSQTNFLSFQIRKLKLII